MAVVSAATVGVVTDHSFGSRTRAMEYLQQNKPHVNRAPFKKSPSAQPTEVKLFASDQPSLKPLSQEKGAESLNEGNNPSPFYSTRRQANKWFGWVEILANVIGTFGFIIGSGGWVFGFSVAGAIIFATSCLFCGLSCCIYARKFWKVKDYIAAFALSQQACGCFLFTICSFFFLMEEPWLKLALIGFFAASFLFLGGCALTQVQLKTYLGVVGPLCMCSQSFQIIPTSFFNTLGSVFFTIGSVFLFFDAEMSLVGAWLYLIGSIVFFLASYGDATVWWTMGLTPSEQQEGDLEEDYTNVKFL